MLLRASPTLYPFRNTPGADQTRLPEVDGLLPLTTSSPFRLLKSAFRVTNQISRRFINNFLKNDYIKLTLYIIYFIVFTTLVNCFLKKTINNLNER